MAKKKVDAPQANNNNNPGKTYNPLTEAPVIDKATNINVNPELLQRPIEEDVYQPPPLENEINPLADTGAPPVSNNNSSGSSTSPSQSHTPQPGNTNTASTPPKEETKTNREIGNEAAQLTTFIFDMYQKAHNGANKLIQIPRRKLLKLQEKGELDLRAMVPYEEDQWMSVAEYTSAYNEQMKDFFSIDPEWRGKMEPPLTRILAKKGLGLSDEMVVFLGFTTDIGVKVKMFWDARAQTNSVIAFAVEQTKRMRSNVVSMPQRPATAPPPVSPQSAPVVNMNASPDEQIQRTQPDYVENRPVITPPYNEPPPATAPMQDHALHDLVIKPGQRTDIGEPSIQQHEMPKYGSAEKLNKLSRHSKKIAGKKSAGNKIKKSGRRKAS